MLFGRLRAHLVSILLDWHGKSILNFALIFHIKTFTQLSLLYCLQMNFIWSYQQIANVYRYNYQTFCVKNVNRFKVDARIRIILNIFWKDLWRTFDWWFCSSTGLHTSDPLHILDIHLVNLQIDLIGDCKNQNESS